VPYFHRPASCHKAVGLMALEYNAMVFVCGTVRTGRGLEYTSICVDAFDAAEYANDPNAVKAIVTRYHAGLEKIVEQYPEQYFWFHRRWKSQPAARKPVKAAA
jgi:KDO2-lipid IV(A) lauroyltransferase